MEPAENVEQFQSKKKMEQFKKKKPMSELCADDTGPKAKQRQDDRAVVHKISHVVQSQTIQKMASDVRKVLINRRHKV